MLVSLFVALGQSGFFCASYCATLYSDGLLLLSCQSGPEAFFPPSLVASSVGEADIRRSVGNLFWKSIPTTNTLDVACFDDQSLKINFEICSMRALEYS